MIIAAVAVLEHDANVFAVFEQVRGIFGFHVYDAGKTTIAGVYVMGAFFYFKALDQLGLDKNRALFVALKAAFGRAIHRHLNVFGFAHAPDIDGLTARLERSAEVDARQCGQQAGDVVGLILIDLGLGHGRFADAAGVDLVAITHDADCAEFKAVAGGGAVFPRPDNVGAVDLDQAEVGALEQ